MFKLFVTFYRLDCFGHDNRLIFIDWYTQGVITATVGCRGQCHSLYPGRTWLGWRPKCVSPSVVCLCTCLHVGAICTMLRSCVTVEVAILGSRP